MCTALFTDFYFFFTKQDRLRKNLWTGKLCEYLPGRAVTPTEIGTRTKRLCENLLGRAETPSKLCTKTFGGGLHTGSFLLPIFVQCSLKLIIVIIHQMMWHGGMSVIIVVNCKINSSFNLHAV